MYCPRIRENHAACHAGNVVRLRTLHAIALALKRVGTMGKQLHFYLSPEDESHLLAQLKQICEVNIIYNVFDSVDQMIADPLPQLGTNPPDDNNLSLIPGSFQPSLVMHSYEKGFSRILIAASECMEFTRSSVAGGTCYPGRLWYDQQQPNCRNKRKLFLDWASCTFRSVRSTLSRHRLYPNRYFGDCILSDIQQGLVTVAPY